MSQRHDMNGDAATNGNGPGQWEKRGPDRAAGHSRERECRRHRVNDSYRHLFFNNHAVMLVIDPQGGTIVDANPAASRFYGYSREELIGRSISDINVLSQTDVAASMGKSVSREQQHFFFRHRLRSGEVRDVEVYSGPIELDGQALLYSIIHDITERKQAEKALQQSEEQLRHLNRTLEARVRQRTMELLEANQALREGLAELKRTKAALVESDRKFTQVLGNSVDIIYRRNYRTGTYDYISPAIRTVLGYDPAELVHRTREAVIQLLIHPEDATRTENAFREIRESDAAGQYQFDYRLRHKDGSYRWVNDSFTFFRDAGGKLLYRVGNIRDITDKKRIEEELRQSEERFRLIADTIEDVFWMFSPADGRLLYLSPAYAKVWQRDPREVYEDPERVMAAIHPDDRDRVRETQAREARGELSDIEFRMLRPDGTVRWIHARGFPVKDDDGHIQVIIGTASDITARKADEETLNDYARQLESLNNELKHFSFIASHDLREPLRKIRTFGEFIGDKYAGQLDETGRDYFRRMVDAARRMDSLLNALLAYSRLATRQNPFTMVDLGAIVRDAISDLELVIGASGGEIHVGGLPSLEADPDQMRQLFQNLIGNALKYRRKDLPPAITISSQCPGETCRIFIRDNGIGFDEGHLGRIFLPFERLHSQSSPYTGIGMGLAICRKIVERHGGEITARSKEGEGSTFIVTLPVSQKYP